MTVPLLAPAMHVPDGFLDVPTSIATTAVALGALGLCVRRVEREIAVTGPALPGMTAAFIFAAQMVNFPVGAGTSGHLLGGTLAAALVGPWTAVVCVSVVLIVQALLFADGGLTALGTNVTLMALIGVLVGWAMMRGLLRVLPRRSASAVPAAAAGALVSVPVAALAFTGLYAIGGAVDVPLPTLALAMTGWHVVIGVGEAVTTAAVLSAVLATRPDLVHAARGLLPDLALRDAAGAERPVASDDAAPAAPARRPLVTAGLVTLLVAGVVSLAASAHPDGLEFVAGALGFGDAARDSLAAAGPLADYAVAGVANASLAGGLAGVVGVAVTAVLGFALLRVMALRRNR